MGIVHTAFALVLTAVLALGYAARNPVHGAHGTQAAGERVPSGKVTEVPSHATNRPLEAIGDDALGTGASAGTGAGGSGAFDGTAPSARTEYWRLDELPEERDTSAGALPPAGS